MRLPRLIARARSLTPPDEGLAYAWHGTTEAMDSQWVTPSSLRQHLTAKRDIGVQEYDLEFVDGRVWVHFISREVLCDPQDIIALLDRVESGEPL